MFNFADNNIYISNKFWVYWAVTIPLTVLVIVILGLWLSWAMRRHNKSTDSHMGDEENIINVALLPGSDNGCLKVETVQTAK
jgi:hypothetical protein